MNSTKRPSRKAELRRLAAKQGWYDGSMGLPATPPEKRVMRPGGGLGYNPIPWDELAAYMDGWSAGSFAKAGDRNPFGVYTK